MLNPFFTVWTDNRVRVVVNRLGSFADTAGTTPEQRQTDYLIERLYLVFVRTLYGEQNPKLAPLKPKDVGYEFSTGQPSRGLQRPPVWVRLVIDREEVLAHFATVKDFAAKFVEFLREERLFGGNFNGPPHIQLDVMLADGHTSMFS
jgi:hypothetical protein